MRYFILIPSCIVLFFSSCVLPDLNPEQVEQAPAGLSEQKSAELFLQTEQSLASSSKLLENYNRMLLSSLQKEDIGSGLLANIELFAQQTQDFVLLIQDLRQGLGLELQNALLELGTRQANENTEIPRAFFFEKNGGQEILSALNTLRRVYKHEAGLSYFLPTAEASSSMKREKELGHLTIISRASMWLLAMFC